MDIRSIRFRLTLWYAVILSAALAVFSGLIWISLRQRMMAEVREDLAGRASRFESFFRTEFVETSGDSLLEELQEFSQGLPEGSTITLRGSDGFTFQFRDLPPGGAGERATLSRQFTLDGEVFDLEASADLSAVLHTLDLLRVLLLSLLPVVVAIACAGGAWLSGRALKPVGDISEAARKIGIENLSQRLPVPPAQDELARLAEVLNSMFARLESAVRVLSQFAADASHELRTPLAVIRTTAELALRRARPPEFYRQSLEEIGGEAERMTRMVEDLLSLARGDSAAVEMPLESLDLREVLEQVTQEARRLGEARSIRLTTEFSEEHAAVAGNRGALHRLFLALLDNALKYSTPGQQVLVSLERRNDEIAASVRDFGPGIDPAELPHIFQRFYRADPARGGGGHGLGLSLAESIANSHGARIEVESSPGNGALFRVIFPVRLRTEDRPARTIRAETA
jgi:heavy metal sensor kinase